MVRVRVLGLINRIGRDPDRELQEFKREFERASRDKDRDALNRMLHPDFSLVTPEGDTVNKQELIGAIVAPESDFMPNYRRRERITSFSVSGNTARETADVSIRGRLRGRGDITGEYTHAATFLRGDQGWQFIGNTLTRRPPAPN